MAEPIPLPSPAQAVTLTALLIPLFRIAGLVVAMGLVFCVDAVTRAFFGTFNGTLGWVPYLGSVVEAPIHKIEQKVSNFLGGLEQHIDASMGWYVHALAINVGYLADGSVEAGWVSWALGKAIHATRVAVRSRPTTGNVQTITRTVVKQTRVVVQRVIRVEKIAGHAAPIAVARQVGALAGELDGVIERDIPSLRDQVKAAEESAARAWKWITKHKTVVGTGVATGVVSWALAKIGASWITCRNWKRIGPSVCRTPLTDIEALVGLLAVGAVVADFRELVKLAQSVQHATATVLQDVAKL